MNKIIVPWYFGVLLVVLAFLLIIPLIIISGYDNGAFSYLKYPIWIVIVILILIGASLRYFRRFGPIQTPNAE
jgi:hypothetical protein